MSTVLPKIEQCINRIKCASETLGRQIKVMEVCGTHTVSIFRTGVRSLLPDGLKLLTGPGCPVCVTDQGYIDILMQLSQRDDCLIATYGDMIRVPGEYGSLETNPGNQVRVVLSADDALELAVSNPDKNIVFAAVGFETTTPASAVVVQDAFKRGIKNFTILSAHKLVVPAMMALLGSKNDKIDAFLCPGHVSVIIGYDAYTPVVDTYKRPCVVAGFEPQQIMDALADIAEQIAQNKAQLKSLYSAVVTAGGNHVAQAIVHECFEICDTYWRGIGKINASGLRLREKYQDFNAFKRFDLKEIPGKSARGCRCGEVLCGLIDPLECKLFAHACTPQSPVGPCMVSSEGACAAWYKYSRR